MNPHHTRATAVHADGIPSLLTPGTAYIVHSVTRGSAGRVWLRVLTNMGTTESVESDYFEGKWDENPDRGELYLTAPIDEAGYIDFSSPEAPAHEHP